MRGRLGLIVTTGAVAAVAGGLAASAVLFSSARGTEAVAIDATVEVRAEEVLEAASVGRALLSETLLLGAGADGSSTDATLSTAITATRSSLEELDGRVAALTALLPAGDAAIRDPAAEMTRTGRALLSQVRQGGVRQADVSTFAAAFTALSGRVTAERNAREGHVAAVRQGAAAVADAARFLVAFVIPALAILAFLWVDHRRRRRVELEANLQREQELRAARDEFLAAVAHELRTPLTAVVGFAETLREGRRNLNTGERDELIEILADQAQDTAAIVEDLLVLARVTLGDLAIRAETVDVRSVVDQLVLGWSRHDRARLTVTGAATLSADPLRLRQILRSLLTNAVQYGGNRIEVRIFEGTPTARIEVADNGPAIPPTDRAHIFEAYRQASRNPGQPAHIGLGLTVARSLARKMAGDLVYRTHRDENIFELTLPTTGLDVAAPGGGDTIVDLPAGTPTPLQILDTIEQDTFSVVFQPIVDLTPDGSPPAIGYEALSRFPDGSPPQWFAAAEAAGLRGRLELAAIRKAVASFQDAPEDAFLTLNVSVETLTSSRLIEALDGISPHRIILELTEDAVVRSYEAVRETLAVLANKGFRVAVDDMGTGQTDLWHLVRFRPDVVKLDISLIRGIDTEPDKQALVTGLTWLCKGLGAHVVAEGVERSEELDRIRRLGVHWAQGYLFGRPGHLPRPETGGD